MIRPEVNSLEVTAEDVTGDVVTWEPVTSYFADDICTRDKSTRQANIGNREGSYRAAISTFED